MNELMDEIKRNKVERLRDAVLATFKNEDLTVHECSAVLTAATNALSNSFLSKRAADVL